MDKVGQKLVRNLKSRKYEVMDGINSVDRVETLQIGRFSPDAYSQHNTSHPHGDDPNHNGGDGSQKSYRELGNDIEMTASVSGVVPDGEKFLFIYNEFANCYNFCRYIYGRPGYKCSRVWQVSSHVVPFYGTLLDGG